jgi:hypothetical protein
MKGNQLRSALFATCLAIPLAAAAQFSFSGPASYAPGNRPDGIAFADFNGDGRADMAVSSDTPDKVVIFLNTGSGSFGAGVAYQTGGGTGPDDLAAADVDGDGDVDIAVTLHNVNAVRILVNNGTGVFTLGASVGTGANPIGIDSGDLNGDGRPDFAVANRDGNSVNVLLNQGGTFAATTYAVNLDVRGVGIGDMDGDGDLDIAASNHDSRNVSTLLNNGAGAFTRGPDLAVGASVRPEALRVADLNGDGRADIAVAVTGNGQNFLTVFLRQGAGFAGPFHYSTGGANPAHLAVADLDCDGDVDVAVANESSNQLAVMANNGAGAFGAPMMLATGSQPEDVEAADLDGDGDVEIGIANQSSNTVFVYKNETCTDRTILPTAFTVTRGVLQSGNLSNLFQSDDTYVNVAALRPTELAAASVEIVVEGISPTETPSSLTLTVEMATSGAPTRMRVEAFNFQTHTWVIVDERAGQGTDTTIQVSLSNPAQFVETGTGAVRVRIGVHDRGVTYLSWGGRFDLVRWTIG